MLNDKTKRYPVLAKYVCLIEQESSAVAEKPARLDSIPNSSRRNP